MRSSRLIFACIIIVAISTTFLLVRTPATNSALTLWNDSNQEISVTALWHERRKDLGIILPGAQRPVKVRNVTSIAFEVQYEDGRTLRSESVDLSAGAPLRVGVSKSGVDVANQSMPSE